MQIDNVDLTMDLFVKVDSDDVKMWELFQISFIKSASKRA